MNCTVVGVAVKSVFSNPLTNKLPITNIMAVTKSMYRGVYYVSRNAHSPWTVIVCHLNQRYNFGSFPTPEKAAAKYNEMALKIKGEKAKLNQVK